MEPRRVAAEMRKTGRLCRGVLRRALNATRIRESDRRRRQRRRRRDKAAGVRGTVTW